MVVLPWYRYPLSVNRYPGEWVCDMGGEVKSACPSEAPITIGVGGKIEK